MFTSKSLAGITLCAACVMSSGCASLRIGAKSDPPRIQSEGLIDSYAALTGVSPYEGEFVNVGLFSHSQRWGNIASVGVWPIGGVGVSFVGVKLGVIPFEFGVGMFGYHPTPGSGASAKAQSAQTAQQDRAAGMASRVDRDTPPPPLDDAPRP